MKHFILLIFFLLSTIAQALTVLESNSSTTILTASSTFTGESEKMAADSWIDKFWLRSRETDSVIVSVISDQDGILYLEQSTDGTNWDYSLPYDVNAAENDVHRITTSMKYFRARYTNTSASDQTYFRLQTTTGDSPHLVAPLNVQVHQDTNAAVIKNMDTEISVATGLFSGYEIVNKFGENSDIDTGTVPETIHPSGGAYLGWATAAENLEIFSSSADDAAAGTGARVGKAECLDANYDRVTIDFTLNGLTGVDTGVSVIRCHRAYITSAGSVGSNVGTLTLRQITTTANIFATIVIGRNQTTQATYTVPAGFTAYLRKIHGHVRRSASATVDGFLNVRMFGKVFRIRRNFGISQAAILDDSIYGGITISEKADISLVIDFASTNSINVVGGFDLILVKN